MTSLRWLFLVILAAACSSPIPSAAPTLTPSSPPAPIVTSDPSDPSDPPAPELAHYSNPHNELELDYPSNWRAIDENDMRTGQYTYVVLGTGDWISGCPNFDNCTGPDVFVADAGELVAHLSYFYSGPAFPVFETPPFDALALDSGLAARIVDAPGRTLATVFIPGARNMEIDVRYGGEPSESTLRDVHQMIESIAARSEGEPNINVQEAPNNGAGCVDEIVRGRLARGDLGGPNLHTGGEFGSVTLYWPLGWTARLDASNRSGVFDRNGQFVAREWDEVELGGRGDINEFLVCPDAVSVVRPFP